MLLSRQVRQAEMGMRVWPELLFWRVAISCTPPKTRPYCRVFKDGIEANVV
jgi:hypothetical protein